MTRCTISYMIYTILAVSLVHRGCQARLQVCVCHQTVDLHARRLTQAVTRHSLKDDANCVAKVACRQCAFEEWKNQIECLRTGYVEEIVCSNQVILIDCDSPSTVSPLFILTLTLVIIAAIAVYAFIEHRNRIEQQYLRAYREGNRM